jgi:hypothetical protein
LNVIVFNRYSDESEFNEHEHNVGAADAAVDDVISVVSVVVVVIVVVVVVAADAKVVHLWFTMLKPSRHSHLPVPFIALCPKHEEPENL